LLQFAYNLLEWAPVQIDMTGLKVLCVEIALVAVVSCATAQTPVTNIFQNVNKVIPDGQATGVAVTEILHFADPFFASITNISVVLTIADGYNGDLYGYLTHGDGFAVLLNRVGRTSSNPVGYSDEGMDVILSADGSDIHSYRASPPPLSGGALTGTWSPDGRNVNPQTVLDTDTPTALLGSFNGTDPNGAWTLFLADLDFGQQATLVQWGVIVSAIPEPSAFALIGLAGLVLGLRRLSRRSR
jgi:hypothetical protein